MEAAVKHDWGVVLDRISVAVESALEQVETQEQELEAIESESSGENTTSFQQLTDLAASQEEHLRQIAEQVTECESILEEQTRSLNLWRERLQELHARIAGPPGTPVPEEIEGESDVSDA